MNEKKADILQAALNEFAEHSFEEASVNEIIKTSGTSKGTFYHYFEDKADLYVHLMKAANQAKWQFIQAELAQGSREPGEPTAHQGDIFALFQQQARVGIRFADQYPQYHALGKRLSAEKGSPLYERVVREIASAQDEEAFLEELFAQAYQVGEFSTRFSQPFIRQTVLYLFNHFDEIYSPAEDTQEAQLATLQDLIDFMRRGFSAPGHD